MREIPRFCNVNQHLRIFVSGTTLCARASIHIMITDTVGEAGRIHLDSDTPEALCWPLIP